MRNLFIQLNGKVQQGFFHERFPILKKVIFNERIYFHWTFSEVLNLGTLPRKKKNHPNVFPFELVSLPFN